LIIFTKHSLCLEYFGLEYKYAICKKENENKKASALKKTLVWFYSSSMHFIDQHLNVERKAIF